ncbi:unnamed protein product [Acanthoscelides obtectus]|nr:unnamed protein product [Acanthoscelides obtectus]CAK1631752.1 hypothetical protein AOBTE_LOCUS7133 [Acanthoscelides obtectus]
MQRVRQRLLPVTHPGCSQDPPYGRVTPQVSILQQVFQPKVKPEDPHVDAHRQTDRVSRLFPVLCQLQ